MEFASDIDSRLLIVAAQFRAHSVPFLKPLYEAAKTLPPKDWPQIIDIDSDMKLKFQRLLFCSPSAAPLERLFSTFGWIHDEQRNRLGNEKAAKLLFCFKILNKISTEKLVRNEYNSFFETNRFLKYQKYH